MTADSIALRYLLLVLLAAFTTLRFGKLAALRRRDVDLEALTVTVRRAQAELQDGRLFDKAPKSEAGVRSVSFSAELLDAVMHHLEHFAAPGRDGHVFVGPQGGQLRRSNCRDDWVKARKAAGVTAELHERPLPRTAPRLTREETATVVQTARRRAGDRMRPGPLTSLEIVTGNPRPGLRRWVLSILLLPGACEVHAELHRDGTVLLAANVSWHAARNLPADGIPGAGVVVSQDFIGGCCRDLCATAWELARRLRVDSALQLTATLTAVTPSPPPPALVPVVTGFGGFTDVPGHIRHPRRIQPVTATLTPLDEGEVLHETAQELFTDVMNQFGLDPQL